MSCPLDGCHLSLRPISVGKVDFVGDRLFGSPTDSFADCCRPCASVCQSEAMSFADAEADNSIIRRHLFQLISEYESWFGPAVVFEHGSSGPAVTACGVSRAHVHIVPRSSIELDNVISSIRVELGTPLTQNTWEPVVPLLGREYLCLGEPNLTEVWLADNIPSQLVRRVIAQQSGLSRWDWSELFAWDIMRSTLEAWDKGPLSAHGARYQHTLLLN